MAGKNLAFIHQYAIIGGYPAKIALASTEMPFPVDGRQKTGFHPPKCHFWWMRDVKVFSPWGGRQGVFDRQNCLCRRCGCHLAARGEFSR